jgi:hypothetical protein
MSQPKPDKSETIPGTVFQWRSLLELLIARYREGVSLRDEQMKFIDRNKDTTLPTRGTWSVTMVSEQGMIMGYAVIEAFELADGQTRVLLYDGRQFSSPSDDPKPIGSPLDEFWQMMIEEARKLGLPQINSDRQDGPTVRTVERAKVFRALKESHPTWSQAKVALEASDELGEVVTADTVRNSYRAMGWPWPRADRIR